MTKILTNLFPIFFLVSLFSQCASLQNYFWNRGNDLKDIMNIGVERDVYGLSLNVDWLSIGYQYAEDAKGVGLRYGTLGVYKSGGPYKKVQSTGTCSVNRKHPCLNKRDCFDYYANGRILLAKYGNNFFPFLFTQYHESTNPTNRNKTKYILNMKIMDTTDRHYCKGADYEESIPLDDRNSYTYFPVEFSFGAYFGFRIGFTITELFDFLLGFVGIDFMEDDVGKEVEFSGITSLQSLLTDEKIHLIKKDVKSKSKFLLSCENKADGFCWNFFDQENKKIEIKDYCESNNAKPNLEIQCNRSNTVMVCDLLKEEKIYFKGFWHLEKAKKECYSMNGYWKDGN